VLTGVHVGCIELLANESIRSIGDLKGKRVGIPGFGNSSDVHITLMATQVGLDPGKDIQWIVGPSEKQLFIDGKIDAFIGVPPDPQELRARQVGRVLLKSAVDRPWSQYFCCMLTGSSEFVRSHPAATKRVVRAILKAADFCAATMTCLIGLAVGRPVAALGSALEADPAIPMPSKAMATETKALRYRWPCRLATVAAMVPSPSS
jgi:NitT/TauT family transport system substrate-binding protein